MNRQEKRDAAKALIRYVEAAKAQPDGSTDLLEIFPDTPLQCIRACTWFHRASVIQTAPTDLVQLFQEAPVDKDGDINIGRLLRPIFERAALQNSVDKNALLRQLREVCEFDLRTIDLKQPHAEGSGATTGEPDSRITEESVVLIGGYRGSCPDVRKLYGHSGVVRDRGDGAILIEALGDQWRHPVINCVLIDEEKQTALEKLAMHLNGAIACTNGDCCKARPNAQKLGLSIEICEWLLLSEICAVGRGPYMSINEDRLEMALGCKIEEVQKPVRSADDMSRVELLEALIKWVESFDHWPGVFKEYTWRCGQYYAPKDVVLREDPWLWLHSSIERSAVDSDGHIDSRRILAAALNMPVDDVQDERRTLPWLRKLLEDERTDGGRSTGKIGALEVVPQQTTSQEFVRPHPDGGRSTGKIGSIEVIDKTYTDADNQGIDTPKNAAHPLIRERWDNECVDRAPEKIDLSDPRLLHRGPVKRWKTSLS